MCSTHKYTLFEPAIPMQVIILFWLVDKFATFDVRHCDGLDKKLEMNKNRTRTHIVWWHRLVITINIVEYTDTLLCVKNFG